MWVLKIYAKFLLYQIESGVESLNETEMCSK